MWSYIPNFMILRPKTSEIKSKRKNRQSNKQTDNANNYVDIITVYGHFSRGNLFIAVGWFVSNRGLIFSSRRAQTTRKFLFCYITSITCSKSRSWYFRGLVANRKNMVTAEKWPYAVCTYSWILLLLHCLTFEKGVMPKHVVSSIVMYGLLLIYFWYSYCCEYVY